MSIFSSLAVQQQNSISLHWFCSSEHTVYRLLQLERVKIKEMLKISLHCLDCSVLWTVWKTHLIKIKNKTQNLYLHMYMPYFWLMQRLFWLYIYSTFTEYPRLPKSLKPATISDDTSLWASYTHDPNWPHTFLMTNQLAVRTVKNEIKVNIIHSFAVHFDKTG